MDIYDSYSCPKNEFKIVQDTTICYLSAGILTIHQVNAKYLEASKDSNDKEVQHLDIGNVQSQKTYIKSERNGFQAYGTNPYNGLIALVDYGLNPSLHIYQYPELKKIQTIENIAQLEVSKISFSLDGKRMIVCTSVPNYELTIWDVTQGKKLEGKESTFNINESFLDAQFNPQNENQFVVLFDNVISVCEIKPILENFGNESYRITQQSLSESQFNSEENKKNYTFKAFIWDDFNNIYLSHGYNVHYLNDRLETVQNPLNPIQFEYQVSHLLLTQKHLIVYSWNKLEWVYKYDPSNLEEEADNKPFKKNKYWQDDDIDIMYVQYSYNFKEIYALSVEGNFHILAKQAESNEDEDDEENQEKQNNEDYDDDASQVTEVDQDEFEKFHQSKIIFLQEIQKIFLLSVSTDEIKIRNLATKKIIAQLEVNFMVSKEPIFLTTATVSKDDSMLIIGSENGVIRIVDLVNFSELEDSAQDKIHKLNIKYNIRLYNNKPISRIQYDKNNDFLAVSSNKSKKIFFFEGNNEYQLLNYVKMPIQVNEFLWHDQVIIVLAQFLLLKFDYKDTEKREYTNLQIQPDIFFRKVDPDLNQAVILHGYIYCSGDDRIIKKYKLPEEPMSKFDLKNKQPNQPLDEIECGNPLKSNLMTSFNNQFIVLGSQEGGITFFDPIENTNSYYKVQSLQDNGVSAIHLSSNYNLIYTGGYSASVFTYVNTQEMSSQQNFEEVKDQYLQEFEENRDEFKESITLNEYMLNQPECNRNLDEEVPFYLQVLQEKYLEIEKDRIDEKKNIIIEGLNEITSQLENLIMQNEQADELEKLSRDDFAIDIERREEILHQGKLERDEILKTSNRENLRTQLLRQIIQEKTWDTMDTQLKGVNSLNGQILMFNYHIRQRNEEEMRRLKIVKNFRKIEILEQEMQQQKDIKSLVNYENLQQYQEESYTVNSKKGKQKLVLIDYQKKMEEQKLEDEKQKQKGNQSTAKGGPAQKTGGLGGRKKQEEKKKQAEEENQITTQNKIQDVDLENQGETDWDYLYGSLELTTNNRKINQIIMLKNIVFLIKEDFNKQFQKLVEHRQQQVDLIHEKNKRIEEILEGLHKEVELFQVKPNILENPDRILEVTHEEIGFERYLTREERDQIEKARQKELERLRLLAQDDAGQRAIKQMMGGTLEEKKENPLDEELQREDWMDKPVEELTDEQRFRLKEFEVNKLKQEEEKEKIRKNLENELKKVSSEINEICSKFDEKLLLMFKARLEYDQRIYEQELYMIRLTLQIINNKQCRQQQSIYSEVIQKLHEDSQDYAQKINLCNEKLKQTTDFMEKTENEIKRFNQDQKEIKAIWQEIFEPKDQQARKKRVKDFEDELAQNNRIVDLDPFIELKKNQIIKEKEIEFDFYKKDLQEKVSKKNELRENYQHIESILEEKFLKVQSLNKTKQTYNDMMQSLQYYQDLYQNNQNLIEENQANEQQVYDMLAKQQSNIEIILRVKQGLVEISQEYYDKPSQNLEDAILIPRQLITEKNEWIQQKGKSKIELMETIKNKKLSVAQSEYELKKKKLNIQKTNCSIKEVQLLKVKKEMQNALTKKDMKLNETAMKRLQSQVQKLKEATASKIKIYVTKGDKISEQIDGIQKENRTLNEQLRTLHAKNKNNADNQDEDDKKINTEAFQKFKQIAHNRKLFEMARRQTEEIELLREELNKLKAKTFANFTGIQKQ